MDFIWVYNFIMKVAMAKINIKLYCNCWLPLVKVQSEAKLEQKRNNIYKKILLNILY